MGEGLKLGKNKVRDKDSPHQISRSPHRSMPFMSEELEGNPNLRGKPATVVIDSGSQWDTCGALMMKAQILSR